MKIAWFCIPAHGHVNPTLALVKELTDSGHDIFYFSFEQFREKIENVGARFISCDGYDFQVPDKNSSDRAGKDMVYFVELIVKSTLALEDMVSQKVSEIKPDLIVSDSVAFWGKLTAMKYNVPYVSSTTTFAYNIYSSRYMQQSIGDFFKLLFSMPKMNKQVKKLQERGYPVKSILQILYNDNRTNTIVYTSKEFQPCADTFSDKYCFMGPSIRPISKGMKKTAEKTIYISMGTVVKNSEIYNNCIEVLGNTEYQVIISQGDNVLTYENLPENIEVYTSVDQIAVLSIADVFLTHCGMNSTSEALYYEVPLVMFPQTPEQGAVAKRVEELGAGKKLISTDKSAIKNAIETVLSDSKYKIAATKISQGFKNSGGVKVAKEYLEKF